MAARPMVLIDGRMAVRRRTGAASYINDLADALRTHCADRVDVRIAGGPPPLPRRNALTSLGNLLLDLAWTHMLLPIVALVRRADVVHAPFNWSPVWSPCPTVVTVQDLAWERKPDTFPAAFRRYARWFTKLSVRRATTVLTTSTATAGDLTALYRVPASRIRTVPIGVTPDGDPPLGERDPFILAVGEFEPRKRIPLLVDAHRRYWHSAPPDPPPCRLVVVGSGGSDEAAVRAAAGAECELLGFVPRERLLDLYRRATLLVYPSSYEGFGLPVLEAMAHATPVLVARNSSLVEVGGAEALFFDGDDPEALAQVLADTLRDRPALRARGCASLDRAATFDWASVANRTADVYLEAAGR